MIKQITVILSSRHGFLDNLLVDFVAHLHAVLQVLVVVCVGAACFDVLVDGVDLRFVGDQPFLNLVQLVVDLGLHQLILFGVVFHAVVGDLL